MASAAQVPAAPAVPTPPWMFLFLDVPFGAAVGFYSIVMPFWLSRSGLDVTQIATVVAASGSPHALKLLWIPLLDIVGTRRGWYLATAAATAALFLVLASWPGVLGNVALFGWLATALQAVGTTCHAANNALMATTTRPEDKGKVGGFAMASNVGFTGLMAALMLLATSGVAVGGRTVGALGVRGAALLVAALVAGSALLALRIVEPARLARAGGARLQAALQHLGHMLRDLWRTVVSREGATGIVICLAPVGCQVLSNLFSALAPDYGAGEELVSLANGAAGGVAGALGALAGGVLADRINRRVAYATSGGLTALCALAMLAAPMTPLTYLWGTFTYLFAGGLAFATWAGMVLELVGHSPATATKYALFNASLNVAITYDTYVVGQLGRRLDGAWGLGSARGLLAADAAMTGLGILLLLGMVALTRPSRASAAAGR
ncbi:MAG: MFS transporter [Anaeromyxobacter sp.]